MPKENIFYVGSTGTGKTCKHILPDIKRLSEEGTNMLICDVHDSLFNATVQLLESNGYLVKKFDVASQGSCSINILDAVRRRSDIRPIVSGVMGQYIKPGKVEGILLYDMLDIYCFHIKRYNRSMPDFVQWYRNLLQQDMTIDEFIYYLGETLGDQGKVKKFKNISEKDMDNAMTHVSYMLDCFSFGTVKDALDHSDIYANWLDTGDHKVLFVEYSTINSIACISTIVTRSFLQSALTRHNTLAPISFIMDEFPNNGVLDNLQKALETSKESNVAVEAAIMVMEQLEMMYPENYKDIQKAATFVSCEA